MAVPLVRNTAGKILVQAELEIGPGVKWARSPAEQPTLPIGILFADGRYVFVVRDAPPRAVKVPTLIDGYDLAQFAGTNDIAHFVLIGIAEPLRAHLDNLLARPHGIASQQSILNGIGHGFLAIAVLAGLNNFRQDSRVLVISRSDHYRIKLRIREKFLGVFVPFWRLAEQLMRVIHCALPVDGP